MKSPNEKSLVDSENQEISETNPELVNENLVDPSAFKLPASEQRLPAWRVWVPLLLQIALIVSVPAQAVYTHITGKTVILQTAPVDPYDLLRGYSQTLGYDISNQNNLNRLPGWKDLPSDSVPCPVNSTNCSKSPQYLKPGTSIYVILEAPKTTSNSGRPKPWKPVRVSINKLTNLPANQVAIKGKYNGGRIEYGLETYYMPENRREEVNADIRETQSRQPQSFVVETKIDAEGHAVPVSLWVRDRNYRF
ncbi:GDYXXLXY domain-containing protein [Kamptonema sp. UHCC 0994]|uniref:GDYXXLXY domain-containing protein n=1 Tax=Kamptonema sp. UHCC 0994 TaxID=3031329 RepID=UPI0023B96F76|nr:GDYXXLXY domain-containing protein [Kamptonema sp. UHCC 0994]MDF0552885.1 GDYXXLXY domain-containing protein [Kamptonema sp. UHCC 0994]